MGPLNRPQCTQLARTMAAPCIPKPGCTAYAPAAVSTPWLSCAVWGEQPAGDRAGSPGGTMAGNTAQSSGRGRPGLLPSCGPVCFEQHYWVCVCGCCPLLFAAAAAAAAQATQPMRSSGVYLCCAACCTQAPAGARQSGPTRAWGSTGSEGGVSGCTSDVLSYCSVLLCLAHAACAWPPCELDLAVGSSLRGGPRTCCQLHERPTASLVVLYLPPAARSTGCAACSSGRHHMQVLRGAASATGWLNGLCAVARGCGFTKHATALPARQTPFLRC